jgi:DNA-binding XRE family transcriptional regulator
MAESKATGRAAAEAADAPERGPEEIEREIEETREELAETVGEVAQRIDVKRQAKAKVDEGRAKATETVEAIKRNPAPYAGAAAAAGLFVLWRRRRR